MDTIEKKILARIDARREEIIAFGRDLFDHGELGYKEYRTAGRFVQILDGLGIPHEDGLALTGVKGRLKPQADGPVVALIGEMDALRIPGHPHYNPETQGAHCCGHNAQMAGIVGAAMGLCDPEIMQALEGNVLFFAVPSEEYGEVEFKNSLMAQGKIRYGGGKSELLRIGAFDEVDMAVTHHASNIGTAIGGGTSNAFVSKVITYTGRAAHAAGAPHEGINALHAAMLGLSALAYQRETFRDEDHVRIHPILTQGGDLVNVVPDCAVVETLVRAKTVEALRHADAVVDRAFRSGAMGLGAKVRIDTVPGYLSTLPLERLQALEAAARTAIGGEPTVLDPRGHNNASTDVGDLCHVMPTFCFNTGRVTGTGHGTDYAMGDEYEAYIVTAKIFALTAYHLLRDGAVEAQRVKESYHPVFTLEAYRGFMDSFIRTETVDYGN